VNTKTKSIRFECLMLAGHACSLRMTGGIFPFASNEIKSKIDMV